jgi:cyclophilin family peptidyl-prolyl cis-trans isomerase
MGPQDELQLRLTFDANMPVGVYNDQIYLKDEDGLAEPLIVEYTVKAKEPYKAVDENKYPYNMSVCGQVKILTGGGDVVYDTDENDIVYAMYKNECVGMANVSFDNVSNKSDLYITIHGNKDMNGQSIRFQLWQSSTGKVFDLASSHDVTFAHGSVYGCGNEEPVVLVTNGNERQTIALSQGWNWASFNLNLPAGESKISKVLTADKPWTDDDIIKNPATRHFVMYSSDKEAFVGDFDYLRHIYTYMIYSKNGNTMHVSGNNLSAESMLVTVKGDGNWSALPCLLKEVTPVAEALSDYYDNASPGDIIKSHNHFATFSKDRKWVGDLAAMRPGEGYFLRRMAHGSVDIHFYNKSHSGGLRRGEVIDESFTNAEASTNMTIIASVEVGQEDIDAPLNVMVDNELAGVAAPVKVDGEAYYFITVQSSKLGALQFEMDGEALVPAGGSINYSADSHHGSLTSPVVLKAVDDMSPYKIIEDNQVIIIRGDERYDITGRKLNNRR